MASGSIRSSDVASISQVVIDCSPSGWQRHCIETNIEYIKYGKK